MGHVAQRFKVIHKDNTNKPWLYIVIYIIIYNYIVIYTVMDPESAEIYAGETLDESTRW